MIDDEVQMRPIARGLGEVRGHPVLGVLGRARGETFVDADVEEAGVLLRLALVPGDDLVDGIRDEFVIELPDRHVAVRVVVGLGRVGDVVGLPRVRVEVVDLPLRVVAEDRVVQVSHPWIELAVGEHSRRAGDLVDPVPDGARL